ncbi:alkyl sulfatase C-terminal domain-containing protein [Streptomyces wuyuanensis]|uniref:alkyl sulfatase C-terminal domain-containing protein n=1 Tax=Streptomyces wuyuanensis TaxID=1196353 RepID=UPI003712FDAA
MHRYPYRRPARLGRAHRAVSRVPTDEGTTHVVELRNGALNHRAADSPASGSTTLTPTRPTLVSLISGGRDLPTARAARTVSVEDDPADLDRLVDLARPGRSGLRQRDALRRF